jgi:hypothetical protein
MTSPIIFFSYRTDVDRLENLFKLTSLTNPKKRIILIEGQPSSGMSGANVECLDRDKYSYGPHRDFLKQGDIGIAGQIHFQYLATRDEFENWCIVSNIMATHDIPSCWVFNSNALLLDDLEPYETDRSGSMEQLSLFRLTGFVSNRSMVTSLLAQVEMEIQDRILSEPRGTSEAGSDVPKTDSPASVLSPKGELVFPNLLNEKNISRNGAFIGSLYSDVVKLGETDIFEKYDSKIGGIEMRKIYIAEDGNMYFFHIPSNTHIRLAAIDLGQHLAECLYRPLSNQIKRKYSDSVAIGQHSGKFTVFDAASECRNNFHGESTRSQIERKALMVTEKLIQKLKKLREQDPNIYPLD